MSGAAGTRYFRLPSGDVCSRAWTSGGPFEVSALVPAGAVEITAGQYQVEVAAYRRRHEDRQARDRERAVRQTREDYLVLCALGVPDAAARRMSGFTGEVGEADGD
ncbi:hypothetical protein [Nonomuraea salmonea]|uniref:Uncharacterized protein n=1 Tax=Nonomuraea salmonea TaxID=46181 RepID=A0ABV5P310_9ACTN